MAHYHDYHGTRDNRINYSELEHSRVGSRAILVVLGLIALGIIAMFVFGDVQTGTLPASTLEQGPATAPLAPAE